MPGMIAPLVQLSSRPDLEVTPMADALSDVLRAGSILPARAFTLPTAPASIVQAPARTCA